MNAPSPRARRPLLPALLIAIAFGALGIAEIGGWLDPEVPTAEGRPRDTASRPSAIGIVEAFRAHRSNVDVDFDGKVSRLLADDLDGSRHQRFIVRVDGVDQTVLIAHNIDLARRAPVKVGDRVKIRGEFEWGAEGGVVHWTHHDPVGRHRDGFIRHRDVVYQ